MHTLSFRAMNTSALLAAEGEGWAQQGLLAAQRSIESNERRFSRFLPTSELTRLNQSAGQWMTVSADMLDLLQQSLNFYRETEGIFDPSILPDLKRIGYDRTMDEVRQQLEASSAPASAPTDRPRFDQLELDLARGRVRLPRGMELDLGGIAKGWIVEQAASQLDAYARVHAVNAGGDMLFTGQPEGENGWTVYLEDPRNPSEMLAELSVESGAVATSSVVKRAWMQAGQARHHLIDPRTGEPAQTDWLSVTVTAPRLTVAEVYAKVLLIVGPSFLDKALTLHPELRFIAVGPQGELTHIASMKPLTVQPIL